MGLHSPKREPDEEDLQEIQVSDQEDTESGGADPLTLKDDNDKYETRGEAQEEEAPSGNEPPGTGKGRRPSRGTSQEGSELPGRRAGKGRSHQRERISESKEELLAGGVEDALEGSIPRPTGRLTRKVERPGALPGERDSSLERSDLPRGQEETGLGGPMDPEMYQLGGRQLYLVPAPSTKGPTQPLVSSASK